MFVGSPWCNRGHGHICGKALETCVCKFIFYHVYLNAFIFIKKKENRLFIPFFKDIGWSPNLVLITPGEGNKEEYGNGEEQEEEEHSSNEED